MRDILYINVEKHLETYFEYPAVEREKDIQKGKHQTGKNIHDQLHKPMFQ